MSLVPSVETIVALATPVGRSAIALVRASGPMCEELARGCLGLAAEKQIAPRRAIYGTYSDLRGQAVDDVVLTFFPDRKSYTGEAGLEISCHGNPLLAQTIIEDLLARGCRTAEPGEFTRRAFLNGRIDLTQAEAVVDLINANSARALMVAHQQLNGGLSKHVGELVEDILQILARIEAYIDFPDEDLPEEDRAKIGIELANVLRGTERLLATQHYGDLLRDGIKTVIIGEPNAGKSSLMNRLVGRQRALVSPEPGTTRDYLEERIIIGEHVFRIIDTAGLNPAPQALERLGIEQTYERAHEADLFLWVLDGTAAVPSLPDQISERITALNLIILVNKTDLAAATIPSGLGQKTVLGVSALTGDGMERLHSELKRRADSLSLTQGAESIAINARHADALQRATAGLSSAKLKITQQSQTELLSSDLRAALDALGEIGGRIDNERMLDHLFATFCIGK